MKKEKIIKSIEEARKKSKKRKFTQSFDLIINLKEVDLKQGKIEEFIVLPNGLGKEAKICALVGREMKQSEKFFDKVIFNNKFSSYRKPRKIKKLARKYDYFIAQANIMPKIAQTFGRYFGPVGKMPNPKNGQILPPTANVEPVVKKLKKTCKIKIAKSPIGSCKVGNEKMSDSEIAENVLFTIEHLENVLPRGKENIKNILIKTTMGGPAEI